jgi:lysophospholipase L1-like esterase
MHSHLRATLFVIAAACTVSSTPTLAERRDHWVGTWSTALHQPNPGPPGLTNSGFANQTLRQIVHTSIGGPRVRVRLSTFGAGALIVGSARIALRHEAAVIAPGTDRVLSFGGQPSIRIPAGAVVLSDPVELDVPPLSDLAISVFVPGPTGPATWHFSAQQTSYVSPAGDFSDALDMPVSETRQAWFWLSAVEVETSKRVHAIAAFGDSLTDGARSTPDRNRRWPDELARRLLAQRRSHHMGVLNAAISGNRLVFDGIGSNAVARLERDVLAHAGVSHVIVLLGNNDIIFGHQFGEVVTSAEIIQAHRLIIARARAHGLTVIGATLPPFKGFGPVSDAVFPALDAERRVVNDWLRSEGDYDAVIDFDALLRDPTLDSRLLPRYDSGDHLHPNDTGYQAMGAAIDLALFRPRLQDARR